LVALPPSVAQGWLSANVYSERNFLCHVLLRRHRRLIILFQLLYSRHFRISHLAHRDYPVTLHAGTDFTVTLATVFLLTKDYGYNLVHQGFFFACEHIARITLLEAINAVFEAWEKIALRKMGETEYTIMDAATYRAIKNGEL
jgi:hypothetical protein